MIKGQRGGKTLKTAAERDGTVLCCISNTVLNLVLLQHKKQLWFRKWSRLKCLGPSFPFSFIIAVNRVTKNSSHDVINFTEESSVFLELFILHKTFIKCYQTTCKSSIIKSISIKIRMNLGTSYILWDYSSTVPCMWLQNTFSAILDPLASLGRLLIFEHRCWTVLSQLPAMAKGRFPSGKLHLTVCGGLTILPLPASSAFSHAAEHQHSRRSLKRSTELVNVAHEALSLWLGISQRPL